MRFGKNQGCDFLNNDCEVERNSDNKFKNDLFTVNNIFQSICSSGRKSRDYNFATFYSYIGKQYSEKEIALLAILMMMKKKLWIIMEVVL